MSLFKEDDLIHSYTADQAIEDGMLADVSELAREAGFKWPVRITQGVHELCTPPESNKIESYKGRLWDVLFLAHMAIKRSGSDEILAEFKVKIGREVHTLWACLDSTCGPAIHIILPSEY